MVIIAGYVEGSLIKTTPDMNGNGINWDIAPNASEIGNLGREEENRNICAL